jgi:protein-disulfide isomerase
MTNKQTNSFYQSASINLQTLVTVLGIAIIATTIYLTNHYLNVHFPVGLGEGSLCDVNSFFNCDAATHSKLAAVFGIPISGFGLVIGVLVLFGFFFKSPAYEGTLYKILMVNLAGCLFLFGFSLLILGTLCPFCTVYYVLSALTFFVFWKFSPHRTLDIKSLIPMLVVLILSSVINKFIVIQKENSQTLVRDSLIKQYDSYQKVALPVVMSPHVIAKSTDKFEDAPIQLLIFSDFQCPACKVLSKMMEPIVKRYKGKININYFFYPLDNACNDKMTRSLHPVACSAAYLSNCAADKFYEVHDKIFEDQEELSFEYVNKYAEKLGLTACMNSEENKQQVKTLIDQGNLVGVRSTPTILLNGVKIEGALPLGQFYLLMDELVKRYDKD